MRPGFELLPHTADVILRAWGPTRAACLEQAALGLVASFAEVPATSATTAHEIDLDAGDDEAALVELLEEIVYLLDARGAVPAAVTVEEDVGERRRARLDLVPLTDAEPTGAAPKAIAYHRLGFEQLAGGWRCSVTIDV